MQGAWPDLLKLGCQLPPPCLLTLQVGLCALQLRPQLWGDRTPMRDLPAARVALRAALPAYPCPPTPAPSASSFYPQEVPSGPAELTVN